MPTTKRQKMVQRRKARQKTRPTPANPTRCRGCGTPLADHGHGRYSVIENPHGFNGVEGRYADAALEQQCAEALVAAHEHEHEMRGLPAFDDAERWKLDAVRVWRAACREGYGAADRELHEAFLGDDVLEQRFRQSFGAALNVALTEVYREVHLAAFRPAFETSVDEFTAPLRDSREREAARECLLIFGRHYERGLISALNHARVARGEVVAPDLIISVDTEAERPDAVH